MLPVPGGDKEWYLYAARAGLLIGVANHRRDFQPQHDRPCRDWDKPARAAIVFIHNGAPSALVGCLAHVFRRPREPIENRAETFDGLDYVASYSDLINAFKSDGSEQAVLDAGAMEALKARLEAVKDGISRQSTLIKAIDYMLERWKGLTAFLDDGRLEPDTNTVERSIRPIATSESLCTSPSSICKHWNLIFCIEATRRAFAPHRPDNSLILEVFGQDLVGSAWNDLLRGKNPGLDQPADAMTGDAALLGGFAHRKPRSILVRRTIGVDAANAPDRADTVRRPGFTLSRRQSHTIQRRGDVFVRPSARHAPDYRQGTVRGAALMLAGPGLSEPKLGVLTTLPMDCQNDLAGRLVDVGGNFVHQRPQQLLTRAHSHTRSLPRRLQVFGNAHKIGLGQSGDRRSRCVQAQLAFLHAA